MDVRHTLAGAYEIMYGAHGECSMRSNHRMYDEGRANCWMAFCYYLILCIWCHVRGWGRSWNCCLVCCTHFCVSVRYLISRCVIAVGHACFCYGGEDSQEEAKPWRWFTRPEWLELRMQ